MPDSPPDPTFPPDEVPEQPEVATDVDADAETVLAPSPDSTPPANSEGQIGTGMFVLVAIVLAALVGAGVYVVGQGREASNDAAEAERNSAEILDNTDIDVTDFIDPAPSSIPLGDDSIPGVTGPDGTVPGDTTVPDETIDTPTTSTPDEPAINDEGLHPEVVIDPQTVALAFVNRAPGDGYGKVGVMTFAGERIITELRCSRVDLNAFRGICLKSPDEFTLGGHGLILDPQLVPEAKFPVNDPSRAVVSPDGSIVGWTGFTNGSTYGDFGDFSTITQLIAVDRQLGVNLETDFRTEIDGESIDAPTRNYWGATFVDNDTFYATMQTSDGTWIVEGAISTSRIDTRFENATCPEVSPDGSTIVAKEQQDDGSYQLIAINVATGARSNIGETRSVDDQVEWLDDDTIVYALPNDEEGTAAQPAFDVWAIDVAPGSTPQLLIPFADSPAAR